MKHNTGQLQKLWGGWKSDRLRNSMLSWKIASCCVFKIIGKRWRQRLQDLFKTRCNRRFLEGIEVAARQDHFLNVAVVTRPLMMSRWGFTKLRRHGTYWKPGGNASVRHAQLVRNVVMCMGKLDRAGKYWATDTLREELRKWNEEVARKKKAVQYHERKGQAALLFEWGRWLKRLRRMHMSVPAMLRHYKVVCMQKWNKSYLWTLQRKAWSKMLILEIAFRRKIRQGYLHQQRSCITRWAYAQRSHWIHEQWELKEKDMQYSLNSVRQSLVEANRRNKLLEEESRCFREALSKSDESGSSLAAEFAQEQNQCRSLEVECARLQEEIASSRTDHEKELASAHKESSELRERLTAAEMAWNTERETLMKVLDREREEAQSRLQLFTSEKLRREQALEGLVGEMQQEMHTEMAKAAAKAAAKEASLNHVLSEAQSEAAAKEEALQNMLSESHNQNLSKEQALLNVLCEAQAKAAAKEQMLQGVLCEAKEKEESLINVLSEAQYEVAEKEASLCKLKSAQEKVLTLAEHPLEEGDKMEPRRAAISAEVQLLAATQMNRIEQAVIDAEQLRLVTMCDNQEKQELRTHLEARRAELAENIHLQQVEVLKASKAHQIDVKEPVVASGVESQLAQVLSGLREKLVNTTLVGAAREEAFMAQLAEVQMVLQTERLRNFRRENELESQAVEHTREVNHLRDEQIVVSSARWKVRTQQMEKREEDTSKKQQLRLAQLRTIGASSTKHALRKKSFFVSS